jgi:RNA polymerase sigma-70 factor (ECF subfamily)
LVVSLRSAPHLRIVSDRSPGELSEAALAEALLRREPWAAEAAWKRYSSAVYGLFVRALGRGADMEALTQEVFLRAFTGIGALEEPAALRSFVYSQAVLVMRRELRWRWLRRWFPAKNRGRSNDDALWLLDRRARLVLSRLYEMLDQLSPSDRVVFSLRELEGLSYGEIAEILGKSPSSVKRKVARASGRVEVMVRREPLLDHYVAHGGPFEADRLEGA